MHAVLALLARPLIEAAVSAFGHVLLDFFQTWKAQTDAHALGRVEAERAAAIEAARVSEAMADVPEPDDILKRLREGSA